MLLEHPGLVLASKVDLLKELGDLPLPFEQYLSGEALEQIGAAFAEKEPRSRFEQMHAPLMAKLAEVVLDYGSLTRPASLPFLLCARPSEHG